MAVCVLAVGATGEEVAEKFEHTLVVGSAVHCRKQEIRGVDQIEVVVGPVAT